mmetsp:Transcript_114646/g.335229  ORF Transcript_114646/g.335229 Transcript_114646/m.335229 type:complete len:174 (-) Transcript_114646:39-560(-)
MGAGICQMDCRYDKADESDGGKASGSRALVKQAGAIDQYPSEDSAQLDDIIQSALDKESTATPVTVDDAADDNITRGLELATAIFLNGGEDDESWGEPSPRSGPCNAQPLPLDMIVKAQMEILEKVWEQDAQIRRILQGVGTQGSAGRAERGAPGQSRGDAHHLVSQAELVGA